MKRKLLLLPVLLLLLTGCDATYRVSFNDDNTIREEMTVLAPNSLISTDNLERDLQILIDFNSDEANEQGFYQYERILGNTNSGAKLSYEFTNVQEFNTYSVFMKYCYEDAEVTMNPRLIKVETANEFQCFDELGTNGTVTVEIETDYKVQNHNASSVNGNVYTWKLSSDKYDNSIQIQIDRTEKSSAIANLWDNSIIFIIILIVVVVIIGGIIFYAYYRYRKLNNF